MNPRRIASIAALVGGVGWLVKVGLIWVNGGENTDGGVVAVVFLLGLVGLVVALGAGGYTLAEKAPVWLRAVVVVAVPLLVLMVWQLVDQAIKAVYTTEGWLRGELNVLLAAVVALVLGGWGLRRSRASGKTIPAAPVRPVRGRRAAR